MSKLTVNQNVTMTSSELALMLGYEKKEVHRKIKLMFADKLAGGDIPLAIDNQGRVTEYYLPELESKMFVAKHDINYLETITKFWIDGNKVSSSVTISDQMDFAESTARIMNLQGSALLGLLRKVQDNNGIPNMLPDYTIDSPAGNVLGSMVCDSASALLKIHSPKTSAMKFNKMACEAGYLKQESRSSTKHAEKVKKYWSVTETGAKFGKNVTSDRNQNETTPRWYSETFLNLVNELLGCES